MPRAAILGALAIVFGTFLMAAEGNEFLAQTIIAPGTAAARAIPADCRADEAAQEGVSPAECELMVANVRIMLASRPPWFRTTWRALALLMLFAAFASVLVGLALIADRPAALGAAPVVFALLLALDVGSFTAAFYTGPLLRATYLWTVLLWMFAHMCLLGGALAARAVAAESAPAVVRRGGRSLNPILHVLLAASTFFVLVSSWWMMALPLPSKTFTYRAYPFQLHKNVGFTMVAMVLVMLYTRLAHLRASRASGAAAPRMPSSAVVQTVLLYVLILACCLSGYLSSVYSGWPTRLWWLVTLPNWGYDNDALNDLYADIHTWTTYGVVVVMIVHIGTATYRVFRGDRSVRWLLRL
jgi:cytochrome b561